MKRTLGACLFAVAAGLTLAGCGREIPPAQVGIKFSADSGLGEQLLKPQVVWVGWRQRLILYPTNIRNATYTRSANEGEKSGDDSIRCSTNEGAILPVDVTVSYHVDPGNVVQVYENFGTNDMDQIQTDFIRPTANWAVNRVSGEKSVFELTSKERAQFGSRVRAVLAPKLVSWGITVDEVFVGEVYPPDEVKRKVDERISVRAELDAATVALKRSKVEAETILTKAKEEAEVNRLLAEAGDRAIELKRIELRRKAIEKWDGASPLTGDGKIPFTTVGPGQ
jgi:regulator of protease activity HflC (stomatin/prohibitin superfamily)